MVAGMELAVESQDMPLDISDERPSLDVTKALKLRINNHLSYDEIGKLCGGYSRQAVHQALKPFLGMIADPEARQAYKESKADVLEGAQLQVITNLVDNERLKKASVNNLAYAAQSLDNMIRLERGQSTANISYADHSKALSTLIDEQRRLANELGLDADSGFAQDGDNKDN